MLFHLYPGTKFWGLNTLFRVSVLLVKHQIDLAERSIADGALQLVLILQLRGGCPGSLAVVLVSGCLQQWLDWKSMAFSECQTTVD